MSRVEDDSTDRPEITGATDHVTMVPGLSSSVPGTAGQASGTQARSEHTSEIRRFRFGPWLAATALLAAMVAGWFLLGASPATPEVDGPLPQLRTFAGIPPVAYLVERVGGSRVRVDILVQAGQDPHLFEPTPHQVMALSKADLFFKIGMPFENRLIEHLTGRHQGPAVVDTTVGVAKRRMVGCGCEAAHDHDEHHDAQHHEGCAQPGEPDPHVWLSPRTLPTLAANIAEALCHADPAGAPQYRKNLAALTADLRTLDTRIRRVLTPFRGQSFYVFHPAFGYFGDAYGLKQESVEIEGKTPTPRQLRTLIHKARADGVKIIFLQPQFDPRSAEAVAHAIGGAAWPMNDLAKDVLNNLDDVATKVASSLKQQPRRGGIGASYASSEGEEHAH